MREPQLSPGLSMRHAALAGGVVTLRQETGASTGGLAILVDVRRHSVVGDRCTVPSQLVRTAALMARLVVVDAHRVVTVAHRVDGNVPSTGRAIETSGHSFVSSLTAAHHKRRRQSIAPNALDAAMKEGT